MLPRTRFAPSPTGYLHIGHAYSALMAWQKAEQDANRFLLRIDDLDYTRSKPEFENAIYQDLQFLGISWAATPVKQSHRTTRYADALSELKQNGLVYPCYLSRKEVAQLLTAPHHAEAATPSTKNALSADQMTQRQAQGIIPVWRLDSKAACSAFSPLFWRSDDGVDHQVDTTTFGDVIIGRRDIPYSYHLSVVIDDADSAVDLVVRGVDLMTSTPIHRLLQAALGLPSPTYHHHQLLTDETGHRLAKRDNARSIQSYRKAGLSKEDIQTLIYEQASLEI